MATVWYPSLAIAVGYNNAANLGAIEAIHPAGAPRPFLNPNAFGLFDPGQFRIRGDGTVYTAGYPTAQWLFNAAHQLHVRYLMETYCANGYTGKVTVRTRTDDPDTYAAYNAIMLLPKLSESDRKYVWFRNYGVTFVRMVAI